MREVDDAVFSAEDATSEIERLSRGSKTVDWQPNKSLKFKLKIPPTVYPPMEDTNLLAKRIFSLGPGRGKKLLEIGCGSGALSILAASLGWSVCACDINPYAVAASRGNSEINLQRVDVREGGIGPEKFPFEDKFDLIIWNLPYIPAEEADDVLGPMEEAALLDTDRLGLANRLLDSVHRNNLIAKSGRILFLSRENSMRSNGDFAVRKWDELEFGDGEKVVIYCAWKPYENSSKTYLESTGSTNDDLLSSDDVIGTHISTSWQHRGRGRRDRVWESIEGCYAGSWIIEKSKSINPGLLQLSGGLAVLKSIQHESLRIKWPNDILINNRKLSGILVEGRTHGEITSVVLGIGVNIKSTNDFQGFEVASLDEIVDFNHDKLDKLLHCNIASLLEKDVNLPPVDFEQIKDEILKQMKKLGKPVFNGQMYDSFGLNESGELILGEFVVDDGEDVEWV